MTFSGVPGAQSAGGTTLMLAAGGPQAASYSLSWAGPFTPGQMFIGDRAIPAVEANHLSPVAVTLAEMEGLARSDPDWWVIT